MGQNSCANADVIAGLPYSNPTNILGFSSVSTCLNNNFSAADACANTYIGAEEYIYSFTPAPGEACFSYTLQVEGLLDATAPALFIFDGCPSNPGTNCIHQNISLDEAATNKTLNGQVSLNAGTTYFIVLSAQTACYTFGLDINAIACPPAAPGDGCANAETIASLPYSNVGQGYTTCNNTAYTNMGNQCAGTPLLNGNDYFFEYTPSIEECVIITLSNALSTSGLFVYEDCPTLPTAICGAMNTNATNNKSINTTFFPGVTYYIFVSSIFPSDSCGGFDLKIDVVDQSGATCANAINLNLPASLTDQTTTCKDNDYSSPDLCGSVLADGNDIVYTFTLTEDACIGINASNMDTGASMFLKNDCPDVGSPCISSDQLNAVGPYNLSIDVQLGAGTYYLIISSASITSDQLFDLDIVYDNTFNPIGIDCSNPYIIGALPFDSTQITTLCKNDDYGPGNACGSSYMGGHDFVFTYTSLGNECVVATASNMSKSGGLFMSDGCPDAPGTNCLGSVWCVNNGCDSLRLEYTITAPGTYYFTVSGSEGINVQQFDFKLENYSNENCTSCNDDVCHACENAGFEQMDYTGWTGRYGVVNNPGQSLGLIKGQINQPNNSRHTLMSAGSYDPIIGPGLPTTGPNGSDYALRLGNSQVGCQAEMIEYSLVPDSNRNNLVYWYAVVFQDPNHTPGEQPFFMVRMFDDDTGEEILCAHYEVRAGPAIPGFQNGPGSIRWTSWTPVAIPLDDFEGKNIRIEFTNKDCSRCGHFGYSYLDLDCSKLEIAKSKDFLCQTDDTVTLLAPLGYETYLWNTGATTTSIEVYEPGIYSVQLTTITGCVVELEMEVTRVEDPLANFDFLRDCGDTLLYFSDNSFTPDSTFLNNWIWTFPDGSTFNGMDSITFQFPTSGSFDVHLWTENNIGCSDDTIITVDIDLLANPSISVPDSVFACEGDSIAVDPGLINNQTIYNWTGPGTFVVDTPAIVFGSISPGDEGWYKIDVQLEACDLPTDSVHITVEEKETAEVIGDTTICFNMPLTLSATAVDSFAWTPAALLDDPTSLNPKVTLNANQTFEFHIFNDICPDSVITVDVVVQESMDALSIPDTLVVCEGDSLRISANEIVDLVYSWTGPNGFVDSVFSIFLDSLTQDQEGYYFVSGHTNNCSTLPDSTWVEVSTFPTLTLVDDGPICYGDTGLIVVTGGELYDWINPSSVLYNGDDSLLINPTDSTWYYVEGKNEAGCLVIDSILYAVKPAINLELGPDVILCETDSVWLRIDTLLPSPLWSNGSAEDSILVHFPGGDFEVEVSLDGCSKLDNIWVIYDTLPEPSLADSTHFCIGDTLFHDLSNSGAASVLWSDGNTEFTNFQTDSSLLLATLTNGACSVLDSAYLDTDPPVEINLPEELTLCEMDSSMLFVESNPNNDVLWSTGATTDTIVVQDSGLFWVQVVAGKCSALDSTWLKIDKRPDPDLITPLVLCFGESTWISHNATIGSPLWSSGATTDSILISDPGIYWVELTNGVCTARDSMELIVKTPPVLDLDIDTTFCVDVILSLDLDSTLSYFLDGNPIAYNHTFTLPGEFEVSVQNEECFERDSIFLYADQMPASVIPNPEPFCQGDSVLFQAVLIFGDSLLINNEQVSEIWISDSMQVLTTTFNGVCLDSTISTITSKELPTLSVLPPPPFCMGDSGIIAVSSNADSLIWDTGEIGPSIWVENENPHQVTAYLNGCIDSISGSAHVDMPATPHLPPDSSGCVGLSLILDAGVHADAYLWSNGETTRYTKADHKGDYFVDVFKGTCVRRDSFNLELEDPPKVNIIGPHEGCEGEELVLVGNSSANTLQSAWSDGHQGDTLIVNASGTYEFVGLTEYCQSISSHEVLFQAPPSIGLDDPNPICEGDSVLIQAYVSSFDSLIWDNGHLGMTQFISEAGNFGLTAFDGPCVVRSLDSLVVVDRPTLELTPDTTFCEGISVNLEVLRISSGDEFHWENGNQNQSRLVNSDGTFIGSVSNGYCKTQDTVLVIVLPAPSFEPPFEVCPDDTLTLFLSDYFDNYGWTDGYMEEPRIFLAGEQRSFIGVNEFGCSSKLWVQAMPKENCEEAVYVPNAFTPNGDGYNDGFFPSEYEVEVTEFYIFDRWGKEVYFSPNSTPWKGLHKNGELCRPDVYVWLVRYLDRKGNKASLTGHVVLVK